jgi:phosphatidylglycerophosphatase A
MHEMKITTTFLRHPIHFLALGFGTGCAAIAPGTFGTLAGVLVYEGMSYLPWPYYLAVTAFLFVAGIGICRRTAADLGEHDAQAIVWDEIVGYLVTMAGAPSGWPWVLLGFVLFRFFDVVKPWPIYLADRHVKGGLGIMLDDLLAGIYSLLTLHIIHGVL